MTAYSAFFSSGLLAPRHATDTFPFYDIPSPSTPSTPLPDSDIEIDIDRDITPTPDTISRPAAAPQPRLRKRRSSLTIATSPMNAIRSPTRTAGAALQLQMHLPSPSRSRSGSLSTAIPATAPPSDFYNKLMGNIASQDTSLVGRMRSGSVGTVIRPRRGIRRLATVPAPAPPPTAPLPAIPALFLSPSSHSWFPVPGPTSAPLTGAFPKNSFLTQNPAHTEPRRAPLSARPADSISAQASVAPVVRGRERAFSLGEGLRIDEEMKEN